MRAHLIAAADHGAAVVVASADLDELLAVSDRIVVMVGGRVVDSIPLAEATGDRLARALTGLAGQPTTTERTAP
jgi:simple sugar transport system ATP-binding protein